MPAPFARLALRPDAPPMEARIVADLPEGAGWQFEPKWDGFRCLVFRDGDELALMSKSGKPLLRYFPEVGESLLALGEQRFILDGELVLPVGEALSFAALQLRLHPAASRVARLARETPAQLVLFDCLQLGDKALADEPLSVRRRWLEVFAGGLDGGRLVLSPATTDRIVALGWLERTGGALDGVVAKRLDQAYQPGERAMFKRKLQRTADCVVGGYRIGRDGNGPASLLLGLYDGAGQLNYVGFTSSFTAEERAQLRGRLEPLHDHSPFTGSSPGGPSRWNRGESTTWYPLRPDLAAEVGYDQVTGGRFRHGTTFLRWRPDKAPHQCTCDQLEHELRPALLAEVME